MSAYVTRLGLRQPTSAPTMPPLTYRRAVELGAQRRGLRAVYVEYVREFEQSV